jgi:hypothetical protein
VNRDRYDVEKDEEARLEREFGKKIRVSTFDPTKKANIQKGVQLRLTNVVHDNAKVLEYLKDIKREMLEMDDDEKKAEVVEQDVLPLIDVAIAEGKYGLIQDIVNKNMGNVETSPTAYLTLGLSRTITQTLFAQKMSLAHCDVYCYEKAQRE